MRRPRWRRRSRDFRLCQDGTGPAGGTGAAAAYGPQHGGVCSSVGAQELSWCLCLLIWVSSISAHRRRGCGPEKRVGSGGQTASWLVATMGEITCKRAICWWCLQRGRRRWAGKNGVGAVRVAKGRGRVGGLWVAAARWKSSRPQSWISQQRRRKGLWIFITRGSGTVMRKE